MQQLTKHRHGFSVSFAFVAFHNMHAERVIENVLRDFLSVPPFD